MSDCIAVINAGSSSVKFAIYAPGEVIALYRGQVEGIAPRLRIVNAEGEAIADRTWSPDGFNHEFATREILLSGQQLMQCISGMVPAYAESPLDAALPAQWALPRLMV